MARSIALFLNKAEASILRRYLTDGVAQETNVVQKFIHYAFLGEGGDFNLFFPSGKIPLHEVKWRLVFNERSWRCVSL